MPTYVYCCPTHGRFERILRLAAHRDTTFCDCGAASSQVLTPPTIHFDFPPWEPFRSPVTDKVITSRAEHRADLEATGSRLREPGEHEAYKRDAWRREAEAKKADAELASHIINETARYF